MERSEVDEIIQCLPHGQTLFHYYRDEYAVRLLRYAIREAPRVTELRKSRWRPLLDKPSLAPLLSRAASGWVTPDLLLGYWPLERWTFQLSLGSWGQALWNRPWVQTSRPGYNLVLQLNFTKQHNRHYQALIRPEERHPFVYDRHPVAKDALTLAWARLDVDLRRDEALIEELQSDWVRYAHWYAPQVRWTTLSERSRYVGWGRARTTRARVHHYLEHILWPYRRRWAEALLSATLFFLVEELGVRRVFLHSYESGNLLKEPAGCSRPPRSLYSSLPRRFCFAPTRELPRLLRDSNDRYLQGKLGRNVVEMFLLPVA